MEEILKGLKSIKGIVDGILNSIESIETPVVPKGTPWERVIQALKNTMNLDDHIKIAMLAQWILETGRGTTELSKVHFNFGGLKWREEMQGFATPVDYVAHDGLDKYCKFESPEAFVPGYLKFLTRSPYKGIEDHMGSSLDYIKFLKAKGYAGDENYVTKISKLFPEAAGLLGLGFEEIEPDRPTNTPIDDTFQEPKIVVVKGVKFKNVGRYQTDSGEADGIVVHFTAGRFDKGAQDAINTLKWLVGEGLGCMVMDTDGIIYVAENYSEKFYNYHAGTSSWKGRTSLSRYLDGMEICNAGRLDSNGVSWFGQKIPASMIREVTAYNNQQAGKYHKFTEKQEKSLIDYIKSRKRRNPNYKVIVGHDEAAPGRKNDPGGSLSEPMEHFRTRF